MFYHVFVEVFLKLKFGHLLFMIELYLRGEILCETILDFRSCNIICYIVVKRLRIKEKL